MTTATKTELTVFEEAGRLSLWRAASWLQEAIDESESGEAELIRLQFAIEYAGRAMGLALMTEGEEQRVYGQADAIGRRARMMMLERWSQR